MMSKVSILIVEDSVTAVYFLKHTLECNGYAVAGCCDSGEAALNFVERTRPDLVLMDIVLSGSMDGIQAARLIKQKFNVPSVFLTGLTDLATIHRAKVTDAYGYLAKPFDINTVVAVIEMALYKFDVESQLKRSEEKYFLTVNSISDAVLTIDCDCLVTFMNPAALALTGWSRDEVNGMPVDKILTCQDVLSNAMHINPLQCEIGAGNVSRMPDNLLLICKTGRSVPIGESSLSPLLAANAEFKGLIIIFRETSGKFEQEKLRRASERNRKAAIIEGQEQERSRIAMDLHDGLGQMLNAIKMNTRIIIEDQVAANTLLQLLDEAIMESVRISENLLPSKLRDFDLATCLRTLCKTISRSSGIKVDFVSHGARISLSQSDKVNFFRIAQEALNNAVKHADAKIVTVHLNVFADTIRLSIEDDGNGMKPSEEEVLLGGNGLINMRDRAEIMGGQFTVESDRHRGTFINVEVPNKLFGTYV